MDESRPFEKVWKYVVMMWIFAPIMIISAIFLMSPADREYLYLVAAYSGDLSALVLLFFSLYCTPAYVLIFLVTKAADFLRIGVVRRTLDELEQILSIPLAFFALGFDEIYFLARNVELDEDKLDFRHKTANVAGFIIFAAFYARQLPIVAVGLAAASVALFFVASVWNLYRRKEVEHW